MAESSSYIDIPHSNIRRVTAQRLTEAKQSIPHFYLTVDCRVDNLQRTRRDINESMRNEGIKVSVNDFVLRAAGSALKYVTILKCGQ